MSIEQLPLGFSDFLKEAKLNNYAGSDNITTAPSPRLEQNTQLEWRSGDWFYRDIYYGSSYFREWKRCFLWVNLCGQWSIQVAAFLTLTLVKRSSFTHF